MVKGRVRAEPLASGKVLRLRNPAYSEGWWLVTGRCIEGVPFAGRSAAFFMGTSESNIGELKKGTSRVRTGTPASN